jgi:hypothetical protein
VTSATYRQSSVVSEQAQAQDPEDRLLERSPRYRIDAEMVRDYALEASGLLKTAIGGPPVRTYQPEGVWEATAMGKSNTHDYVQDHGSDLYRRSVYMFWKRGAPPTEMDVFGAPSRETCVVRRERTNSPLTGSGYAERYPICGSGSQSGGALHAEQRYAGWPDRLYEHACSIAPPGAGRTADF